MKQTYVSCHAANMVPASILQMLVEKANANCTPSILTHTLQVTEQLQVGNLNPVVGLITKNSHPDQPQQEGSSSELKFILLHHSV